MSASASLRLHILRHGETAWSITGQHTGRTDIPLTAKGENEARALGTRLRGIAFSRVLTSPLQRARQTCALAALMPRAEIEPDLVEWDYWPQFEQQVLAHLLADTHVANLVLLPTCGTKYYQYDGRWTQRYAESLSASEKTRITGALDQVSKSADYGVGQIWGTQIQDRGTQITFSALGQQAPLGEKAKWDPDFAKRKKMKTALGALIPDFSVRLGGTTSIDVTKPGIDKAYGIRKLREILGIDLADMLFAGDAVFPGGNDFPVKAAGVASIQVKNPEETKRVIETFLACLSPPAPTRSTDRATLS